MLLNLLETIFLDDNLLHDLTNGRSVTAALHFFNLTLGDWYSKRQATVEMQPMDQSLLLPRLPLNKLLALDKLSGT